MEWPRTKQCYAWIALKEYIPHMGLSWRLDLFPPKGNDTIGTSLRHRWFMAIFLCKGTDSWWLYQESLILRYSGMTFQATFRIFLTKKNGYSRKLTGNFLLLASYGGPSASHKKKAYSDNDVPMTVVIQNTFRVEQDKSTKEKRTTSSYETR